MKLITKLKRGGYYESPDHDPKNPYHYHNEKGEKIVVTPEDWEKIKNDPSWEEVVKAIEDERKEYSNPEYEVDKDFLADLRDAVNTTRRNWTGKGFMNWRNYGSVLPEEYTIDDSGIVYDTDGNPYVQPQFTQSGNWRYKFERADREPVNIVFNQGKPIEQSVSFYPIKARLVEKKPLQVDRIMNIDEEKKKAMKNFEENLPERYNISGWEEGIAAVPLNWYGEWTDAKRKFVHFYTSDFTYDKRVALDKAVEKYLKNFSNRGYYTKLEMEEILKAGGISDKIDEFKIGKTNLKDVKIKVKTLKDFVDEIYNKAINGKYSAEELEFLPTNIRLRVVQRLKKKMNKPIPKVTAGPLQGTLLDLSEKN